MKYRGSSTGLMELWLMESSPTSPTTLRVGLVGLTKLDLLCEPANLYLPRSSSISERMVRVVKPRRNHENMQGETCVCSRRTW